MADALQTLAKQHLMLHFSDMSVEAGLHKLEDPAWMSGGTALRGYWERAVAIPEGGRPANATAHGFCPDLAPRTSVRM